MRNQLSVQLSNLITILIFVIAVGTPLLFTPLFTEFYEMSKLLLIVVAVLVLVVLWTLSWVVKGKVLLTRSPLDLPLLLLGGVVIASTFFSPTREVAIFGNFPRIHGSGVAYIAYILFYFVTVSHLRAGNQMRNLIYAMLASTILVAVVSLLAYLNIYLPIPIAKFANFTPAGSSFAAVSLMILMLPLCLVSLTTDNRFLSRPVALALATLFTITSALIGRTDVNIGWAVLSGPYIGLLAAYGITFFIIRGKQLQKSLPVLAIPVLVTVLVLIVSVLPIAGNKNVLNSRYKNFPREVQLSFPVSWKISASAFRDAPFLGTGPASFLFNFSQYRPIEFNSTKYWNIRFDSAHDEFLQTLATLGALGLLALLFLVAVILNFGFRGLSDDQDVVSRALSISALLVVVLLAFHPLTVVTMIAALAILAMLMTSHKSYDSKVEEVTIGIRASKLVDQNIVVGDILPIVIFIPVVILAAIGLVQTAQVASADYYHRLALNAAATRGLDTYNYLVKAENSNPRVDLYRTDLAQTNFALANAIAIQKGPTESSPGGSLTDQDKQNIQQLLSQSIRESQVATVLSPRNPANYEILAAIYRQISGVADNALNFSLNSYGQAIKLDPMNPLLRLNVGGVYYSIKNFDLAIRFFTDAVNLKPDWANAYYNLSIALRDKGDLKGAQAMAQQVVSILQTDTTNPDYKLAADYLKDLQNRIATGSAQQSAVTPPAAATSSALQGQGLPKVLDLPKPASESTPPAVKK